MESLRLHRKKSVRTASPYARFHRPKYVEHIRPKAFLQTHLLIEGNNFFLANRVHWLSLLQGPGGT